LSAASGDATYNPVGRRLPSAGARIRLVNTNGVIHIRLLSRTFNLQVFLASLRLCVRFSISARMRRVFGRFADRK